MTQQTLALAADFPAATEAQWRALVDKILKGAEFDKRLVSKTADGLAIKPLYTRADAPATAPRVLPPRQAVPGWEIRQICAEHDPAKANAAILDDLAGGVTAITLQIAAPGWFGLDHAEATLARALQGVLLDVCPIHLGAGEHTVDAAGSLMALWREAGVADGQTKGSFNYDPLGTLAQTGALANSVPKALAIGADFMARTQAMPGVTAMLADGHVWHNAGATEAQELALILATVAAYLRGAETAGIKPVAALGKIAVEVAIDADQFLGIAKVRAARRLIARMAEVCAAGTAADRVRIAAGTSWRMMSKRDPWVNMLRSTAACAAAAMGGADAITVLPFSWAAGRPDAFARRIARNTHIVLQEESGLGRVADPAGGAWYVESLTHDLAQAAWTQFQDIERKGGLARLLETGDVQAMLATAAQKRAEQVARGKLELTGTSAFPKLGSDGVTIEPWPVDALSTDLSGARAKPVTMARLAEPFEALRDAADKAKSPPRLFLATLGPLAVHAARATWMRNFLAAGGIEAVGDEPLLTSADAGIAFARSGARVACLATSDAIYDELGEATIGVLKQAGATAVYLAGKPKDEASWQQAGIDGFIFAGVDMIATLVALHGALDV